MRKVHGEWGKRKQNVFLQMVPLPNHVGLGDSKKKRKKGVCVCVCVCARVHVYVYVYVIVGHENTSHTNLKAKDHTLWETETFSLLYG